MLMKTCLHLINPVPVASEQARTFNSLLMHPRPVDAALHAAAAEQVARGECIKRSVIAFGWSTAEVYFYVIEPKI